MDDQVKIRGQRVELEEVRSCLTGHPAVKNSAVIIRENHQDEKQLVAYVEPDQELAFSVKRYLNLKNKGNTERNKQYILPNGMTIFHSNKIETDHSYKELFIDNAYLRYFREFQKESPCILDIGANIGMFSLLISALYPKANIYSFEPIPDIFEILRLNVDLYKPNIKINNFGISRFSGKSNLTYYPNHSFISNFYGQSNDEKQIVSEYIKTLKDGGNINQKQIDELLSLRLNSRRVNSQTKNLSEFIRENRIKEIDLLKIGAEKSELDILIGIKSVDWLKIKNVVIEVHDIEIRLEKIRTILKKYGFRIRVEKDQHLNTCLLYATKEEIIKTSNKARSARARK